MMYEDRLEEAFELAIDNMKRNAYDTICGIIDNETLDEMLKDDVHDAIYDACGGKQGYIEEIMDNDFNEILEAVKIEFYGHIKNTLT